MGGKEIDIIRKINKTIVHDDGTVDDFEKQLVQLMFGVYDKTFPMLVSPNSSCMSYIDTLDTGAPLVMNVSTLEKLQKKHGIGYEFVINCEDMLRSSVLAFGSMRHKSSIVVVLDEFDKKTGNPFLAICRCDKDINGGGLLVNEITSVYDKKKFLNFLVNTYNNGEVFYKNKKTEQYFAPFGLQLPEDVKYALSDNYYKTSFTKSQVGIDILQSKDVDSLVSCGTVPSDSTKKALYIDIDGTLARFHDADKMFIEMMWTQGFYRELKPFENLVGAVKLFKLRNPDVEIFTLSAVLDTDPPFVIGEKNDWLDEYLPDIDGAHRIFTRAGEDKSKYLSLYGRDCFLLDDYNKNLFEFDAAGGHSIKFHNDVNHRGLGEFGGSKGNMWTGDIVHYYDSPEKICKDLEEIVFGKILTRNVNVLDPLEEASAFEEDLEIGRGEFELDGSASPVIDDLIADATSRTKDGDKDERLHSLEL